MQQKTNRWELLLMVGLMLILVVGLWGTSGSGLRFGSQVLAAGAPQVTTGGGNESSAILATGTGIGKVMPAAGAPGQVAFYTGTTTLTGDNNLYWDNATKRLGVGTASPQRLVHLVGNICLFERAANSAGFIINRNGGDVTGYNRWVFGADEPTGFVIKTYPWDGASGTEVQEQLVITKDDPSTPANESKVGIGTTAPGAKLDVAGEARATTFKDRDNTSYYLDPASTGNSLLVAGNIGIGTTSPVDELHIHRDGSTAYPSIRLTTDSTGATVNDGSVFEVGASQDLYIFNKENTSIKFFTSNVVPEKMVINSAGNVGIGQTSPTQKLQVETAGSGQAVYGKNTDSSMYGYLGGWGYGVYGEDSSVAGGGSGVYGKNNAKSNYGYLGGTNYGVYGQVETGASNKGVYGKHNGSKNWGVLGEQNFGVYGYNDSSTNYGYLGSSQYGVFGSASAADDYAGYFQGNVNVTGTLTVGSSPGVSMGRIYLADSGEILSTDGGTRILYWDKTNGEIEITNSSGDWCDYWWQAQKGTTTTGDSSAIDTGLSNQAIISGTNTNDYGFEVHFGQADGTEGWCSVWLQYCHGNLVGHYTKY